MNIVNHQLEGNGIATDRQSPNKSGPFGEGFPDTLVLHYTGGSSFDSSVKYLCTPRAKASAHVVVGRNGEIAQIVPFSLKAWHAGKSEWKGRTGLNRYSIGIEIDNAGRLQRSGGEYVAWFGKAYPEKEVVEAIHRNENRPSFWHRYTEKQINTVFELCDLLMDEYGIKEIVGHEEIAPDRKVDPGPAFPLDGIRARTTDRDRSDESDAGTIEQPESVEGYGIVVASSLNIRSSAGVSSPPIAPPLQRDTPVKILGREGSWLKVETATRGWVSGRYVEVQ